MKDSIFTKIVTGEIPSYKIYEDDDILAFLDIEPRADGHTLVIPKTNPAEFVWDLNSETYQKLMATCQKIALQLRAKTGKKYVHMSVVGTDVPYAHVHLVPFNDGAELHGRSKSDPDTLKQLAETLKFV